MFVRHLPGPLGVRLRRGYWRRRLGALGDGARIDEVVRRENGGYTGREGEVRLGDDVELALGAVISGSGGVEIGDNVSLGPGAKLFSASNHYRGPDGEPGVRSAAAGMRREPTREIGRQALLIGPVVIEPRPS